MRGLSGSDRPHAIHRWLLTASGAIGLQAAGCFPNFDGLTGSADAAATPPPLEVDGTTESGCGEHCADGPSAGCVDSAHYPGGGFYKLDFSDVSDMVLNDGATSVGGVLRVVGVDGSGLGSAYASSPASFDSHTSLFVHFAMRIGGGAGKTGSDGMAFVVQSSAAGAKALGKGGGGLGYEGVAPSVAIEFDTFFNPATDPEPNHVALLSGGNPSIHIAHAAPAFLLNDGTIRNVWIDYDWSMDLIEIYMAEDAARPVEPLLKHAGAPFMASLGDHVYMGAAAASGLSRNDHELHGEAWFVTSPLPKCR